MLTNGKYGRTGASEVVTFTLLGCRRKMELLYSCKIPRGRVQAVAWSGMNIIALSVSVHAKGVISERYKLYVWGSPDITCYYLVMLCTF